MPRYLTFMLKSIAISFAVLLVLVLPRPASADAGMDAFVAEVIRKNPSLSARSLQRNAFSREAAASGLWPDPQAAVMFDNIGGMDPNMPMLRYQVTQMIPWPGKLGFMEDAARRRTEAASADREVRRLELELEAKRAYLMLLLNARRREINRASRGLVKTVADAALARYSAGATGHHDVVRAQVELNAVDVEGIALTGERVSIVAMMNALRNEPAESPIADPAAPAVDPSVAPLSKLIDAAVARRPELKSMRSMQREQATMAALARRERYPDFMTSVWYNQMLGGGDTVGVMVGASIPIFGARRQGRIGEAAELRSQSVAQDYEAMQAMIRFEVADAARKVETARSTLEFVRTMAKPRAHESFLSSLAGYSTGTVEITGLLESWRALQAAELARAETAVMLAEAVAELERAIDAPIRERTP